MVVASSGDELRSPGAMLAPGQIHDSNSVLLTTLFRSAGAEVIQVPTLPDQLEATMEGLESALSQADLVITAGGASVGDRDFLRPAWERLGGQLDFFKVAIKPGKPVFLGRSGVGTSSGCLGIPFRRLSRRSSWPCQLCAVCRERPRSGCRPPSVRCRSPSRTPVSDGISCE